MSVELLELELAVVLVFLICWLLMFLFLFLYYWWNWKSARVTVGSFTRSIDFFFILYVVFFEAPYLDFLFEMML